MRLVWRRISCTRTAAANYSHERFLRLMNHFELRLIFFPSKLFGGHVQFIFFLLFLTFPKSANIFLSSFNIVGTLHYPCIWVRSRRWSTRRKRELTSLKMIFGLCSRCLSICRNIAILSQKYEGIKKAQDEKRTDICEEIK